MAKVKSITKAQPQPIKGMWWFKIILDSGEEAFYSDEKEEPFKDGDEMPAYEIKQSTGRGGGKNILTILPPPTEQKGVSVTVDSGEKKNTILHARARACIDMVSQAIEMAEKSGGKVKTDAAYRGLVKMVWKQLDEV